MEEMHELTEWVDGWPVSLVAAALPVWRAPVPSMCAVSGCLKAARFRLNGRAACSRECLKLLLESIAVEEAMQVEAAMARAEEPARPLIGHLLVEQGSVTEAQLAQALESQRATGAGRLGCWLKQHMQLRDADLTAALALQWRCPRVRVGSFAPASMAAYLPRPLVEKHGALPLRVSALPDRLSLCFEDHQSPALIRAVERMHGVEVEAGLLTAPEFWRATRELLAVRFPRVTTVEAASRETMMEAIGRLLLLDMVAEARLVAVEDCYWLRVWTVPGSSLSPSGMSDILCTPQTQVQRNGAELSGTEFLGEADALFRVMREAVA